MKLSICIPSYNRASLLKETLESAIEQATDEVEITVSDNGSIDDTEAVVAHYQTLFPRIRYDRFSVNQGADRCYLRCVEIATGEYCWLMGSDDRLEPGAIARILRGIEEHPGIAGISVNYRSYDASFKYAILDTPIPGHKHMPNFQEDKLLTHFEDFFPFPAIYTGYLSGQIVNRILWQDIVKTHPVENFFNAYSLVYVMLHMMRKHSQWLCIAQKCVGYRADNDSFLNKEHFPRLKIDVCSLGDIFRSVFCEKDPIYQKTQEALVKLFVTVRLLQANIVQVERKFWSSAFLLCFRSYGKKKVFWSHLLPFFIIPSFGWKAIRWVYRKTWKKHQLRRL